MLNNLSGLQFLSRGYNFGKQQGGGAGQVLSFSLKKFKKLENAIFKRTPDVMIRAVYKGLGNHSKVIRLGQWPPIAVKRPLIKRFWNHSTSSKL